MFINSNLSDCRLLVVIENQKDINDLLINTVNFTKLINVEIKLLFVIAPTHLNASENPLVFIKMVEDEISKIESKLKKITDIIFEQEKISVDWKVDFGKLKTVVKSYIKEVDPQIVLVNNSSRKKRAWANKVIPNYLEDFKGLIIITNEKNTTLPKSELKLGCFGPEVFSKENKVIQKLLKGSSLPIYVYLSFTNAFRKKLRKIKNVFENEIKIFEFQTQNQSLGILKYLNYCKVDLLCIDNSINAGQHHQYKDVISKSKIPLLIINS